MDKKPDDSAGNGSQGGPVDCPAINNDDSLARRSLHALAAASGGNTTRFTSR